MGKTIAKELFDIAKAQGGSTAGYPPTIAGGLDALADALAGSNVDAGKTIAEGVEAVGNYIGGGGGVALGNVSNVVVIDDDGTMRGSVQRMSIGSTLAAELTFSGGGGSTAMYAAGASIDIVIDSSNYTVAGYAFVVGADDPVEFTDFTTDVVDGNLVISFTMPDLGTPDFDEGNIGELDFELTEKK